MAAIAIQSKGLKDLGSTPETSLLLTMASMHTHRKMNILQLEVPILKPRARIIPSELANKGSQSSPSPRARRVLDCDERMGLPSSKQGTYTSAVNSISRLHTGRLRRAEIWQPQRELRRSERARLRYPTSPGLSAERQLTGPASSATRDAKMDPQRPNLMNEIIKQAVGRRGNSNQRARKKPWTQTYWQNDPQGKPATRGRQPRGKEWPSRSRARRKWQKGMHLWCLGPAGLVKNGDTRNTERPS